ncbi:hypothetical protein Desor_0893 [Desulfosporosinus orientis DSM 765]|uniref:Uncharacterized protein n=1 Tax=Desulfosporosinus orientis (strain ATCC 19365 / DSM 765 / NCIMB 8382 / VKM B-1628 / Singapore I) TaxID=768706 RepID=G7WCN4_DESOD|nr:hypothetical protein Desor_0893 [Desulfosporosinus orientis DSM 765]
MVYHNSLPFFLAGNYNGFKCSLVEFEGAKESGISFFTNQVR